MAPPAVLMVGTGEYTTGFVSGAASTSDKKVGVVGLTRECLSLPSIGRGDGAAEQAQDRKTPRN